MLNSPFSMVVAIVFIACFFGFLKQYMDGRDKRPSKSTGEDETLARLAEMERRVEVLERIVTDSGSSLKREIDRL